jgi:hypothetical protein
MRTKLFIITLLFLIRLVSDAQTLTPSGGNPGGKTRSATVQMVSNVDHDTCINKKFSVVFYVIQDSNNSRTPLSLPNFKSSIIGLLNQYFARICVTFENCSTVVIPDYTFNDWYVTTTDQVVRMSWYTRNVINIYLPTNVKTSYAFEQHSYAHAANVPGAVPTGSDIVVIQTRTVNPHIWQTNDAQVYASHVVHVMGHFFGLPDTFGEIGPPASPPPNPAVFSQEFVMRTNCAGNGDGICDTDADPYPMHFYSPNVLQPPKTHCGYDPAPGLKDGKGNYYTPPLDNFMSVYSCRCRFTQQQYNAMARYIIKYKKHLH